ncbi:MAG: MG2 domain-containing protein, partial [Ignavibacteria bacterium]|nr:MG2 domain-containing protein [Ignavibacteria bacterium]
MMKKPSVAIVSCALALLLSECRMTADTGSIGLSSPLPEGVVSRTSVLAVSFSRAVVAADSVNIWTATPFIEFTPSIPGKFVWQDTASLVFSPDAPLPGDTRFHGKLNTALLTSLSGASSFDGNAEFTFATELFSLTKAEFFYDRLESTRTLGIKANLEFTYAVNPEDVKRAIRVTIDGTAVPPPRVMTTENSKVIAIEIGDVSQTEKERDIAVSFGDEVVSPETQTRLKMEKPFVFALPGMEELKIYGHEFGYEGTNSWIRFRTSQEVDLSSAREFLSIDPVRTYTLEGNRQSFTLRGTLEPGTAFHVIVKKGMNSVLGGKTQNEYPTDVIFGNIKPSFRFASESGVYMMLGGQKAIEIKTVNLSALHVRVSQIFQNNLLFFLDQGRYYDYYWDDEAGASTTRKYRYITGNYGRQLSFDTLAVASATNQEVSTWFDLSPYLSNGYKGFFVVEIANPAESWRSTSKLISVSNLGLMVKQSSDELAVFAVGLETTQPLADALITLVSTNNQVIAAQKTDRDGVVRFDAFRDLRKNFTLKLVTAELENDFNFIHLPDYRVETSRFDVSGKRDAAHSFDAFLYGDRNIYRPGELVHLSGIVRNLTQPLPVQMPVRLKIYNPRGTVVMEQQLTLNEEGSFETQYQTLATSQTGQYRFELWTGNNLFLQSYKVSVEDFVPDRLKVNLTASREEARPGDRILYDLQAFNFFGPPAAGRNWEFEASFEIIPFQSKAFPKFRFADDGATNYTASPEILSGKTNEDGKARVEFALPQNLTSTGLLRARGRVAVFDESGRPVYQIAQTTVFPKQYFVGVLRRPEYYVSPNTAQKMQIIAVDERDTPISGFRAKVDLIRYEWHSVLRQHRNSNTLRYVSERREIPVKSDVVTVNATPTEYSYTAPRSGEYVIRVSRDGETGYNQFSFYAYDWATSDVTSF